MPTNETVQSRVVELRRSPAQILRTILPWLLLASAMVAWNFLSTASMPLRMATAVLWMVSVVVVAWRERQWVLRMSEDGLYEGRSNGKKVPLGPAPLRLAWSDIDDIRVVEGGRNRSVYLQTTPHTGTLRYIPRATVLNPDRTFDERVALLQSIWQEHRVLPPPPVLGA